MIGDMVELDTDKLAYNTDEYDQFYKQFHQLIDPEQAAWDVQNAISVYLGDSNNPASVLFVLEADVDNEQARDLLDKWAKRLSDDKQTEDVS